MAGRPKPSKGFYRSDHLSLAKVGVPMLYPKDGFDLRVGGKAAGQALRDDYLDHRYHQPSDEFDPNWDLSGLVEDTNAAMRALACRCCLKPCYHSPDEHLGHHSAHVHAVRAGAEDRTAAQADRLRHAVGKERRADHYGVARSSAH